jgi:hypothetical protein
VWLKGICFLQQARERANKSDRKAGKRGFLVLWRRRDLGLGFVCLFEDGDGVARTSAPDSRKISKVNENRLIAGGRPFSARDSKLSPTQRSDQEIGGIIQPKTCVPGTRDESCAVDGKPNKSAFSCDLPRMVRAMVEQLVQSFG